MKKNTNQLRTLCKHCADTYRDMGYIVKATSDAEAQPCEVCRRKGRKMVAWKPEDERGET